MRKSSAFVAVMVVAAAVSASLPASAASKSPTVVSVAMLAPNALLWSHAVAVKKGFYARHGVQVEELRTMSSPTLLQAVASGSADAGVSLGDIVIQAIDQGAPITISGAIMDHVTLRLIGGAGISQISQLQGQPVSAGAVEGGTANILRFELLKADVNPRSVQMVSITASSDRLIAMENGQVKGALMTAPFDALAVQKGMKILDVYKPPYLLTPLILNKPWAAAHRDAARGLTQALREAAEWIYDPAHKAEAIQILAHYTKVDPATCEDAYRFLVQSQHALSKTMDVTPKSLENILTIERAVGANPSSVKQFNLANYFDPSYLE